MKILYFFILIFTIFEVQGKDYNGYKVIRFIPRTESELGFLKKMFDSRKDEKLDFWLEPRKVGNPTDVLVPPEILDEFLQEANLKVQGSFKTMIDDVGYLIESQKRSNQVKKEFTKSSLADFDYSVYHTYEEINTWIEDIVSEYSNLASSFVLGTSYEGRKMNALRIGSGKGENRSAIWMSGGIHSREWISPATVIYLVNELLENYGGDDEITKLLDEIDWVVLPVFNVDGYVFTWDEEEGNRLWRKTRSPNGPNLTDECVGVDPNRNWDINFGGDGSSFDPCTNIYCGLEPFSEVEVKAVAEFVNKVNPNTPDFDLYLDVHSYSQLFLTPWSWTKDLPKDYDAQYELGKEAADALKAVHGSVYEVGTSANLLSISAGVSKDWAYEGAQIPFTYTVELRDTGDYGFLLPEDQIIPTCEEMFAALKAAANYILEYPNNEDSSIKLTCNFYYLIFALIFLFFFGI